MKKIFIPLIAFVFVFVACQKKSTDKVSQAATQPLSQLQSTQEINAFIHEVINSKGEFNWKNAPDITLWSAVMHSEDHMVSVGYKPAAELNVEEKLTKINLHDNTWVSAKQQVMKMIFEQERLLNPQLKLENLEVWKENKLPVIDVQITNINTIKLLRQSNLIRYAEPMGYDPERYEETTGRSASGGSGCGDYSGYANLQAGDDYFTILPNTKRSWNYGYHRIPNAWAKTTGAGIKVMVIDTGVSPDQENMGSDFNQGYSTGRTIEKMVTLPGALNANDVCGHGTAMSSTLAAPRGIDGNSCGVAYNSNIIICKAVNDVIIDQSNEVKGVADAYTFAADDPTIKITSMSVGRVTTSSQIRDAIIYAYDKGKLMFCAGGTSTSFTNWFGVIFPATMSQVMAVTGVKDKDVLTACNDCHKGPQIDYVIVMQKISDNINPLANAMSGDIPTIVGGSSVATATSAGIAALVWSRFPSSTREQIIDKLTTTASTYPVKTRNFGYGKLNADLATN